MIKGGIGGANTKTGLEFEGKVDLATFIGSQKGYRVVLNTKRNRGKVFYGDELVAEVFKKHGLYEVLAENGVSWKDHVSKQLQPDNALFVIVNNTVFIIEVKVQNVSGSVDEKLQTCDFKIRQYRKLFSLLNVEVRYLYILSDWFKKPEYNDVLDYINSINGCGYYFEYIPLHELGLPVPPR